MKRGIIVNFAFFTRLSRVGGQIFSYIMEDKRLLYSSNISKIVEIERLTSKTLFSRSLDARASDHRF